MSLRLIKLVDHAGLRTCCQLNDNLTAVVVVDVRDTRTSMDVKMPLSELAHHYEAMMKRDPQKGMPASFS